MAEGRGAIALTYLLKSVDVLATLLSVNVMWMYFRSVFELVWWEPADIFPRLRDNNDPSLPLPHHQSLNY
jgi:hypothetical protein